MAPFFGGCSVLVLLHIQQCNFGGEVHSKEIIGILWLHNLMISNFIIALWPHPCNDGLCGST
jgi:hypothetical protein